MKIKISDIRKAAASAVVVIAGVSIAASVLVLGTAAYRADFKLGQSIELAINMMRGLYSDYVDEVDATELGKNAAAGMVRGLDPYTELIHADDMAGFELMTTGKYGGIGSLIRQKGDFVQIAEPYKGSPADLAGLEIGDVILEIDGKSAKGLTTAEVSTAMKGEAGTTLRLRVRKLHSGETKTVTIRREVIKLPAIPYFGMVADGVGYVHHSDFTDGCADQLRQALDSLKSLGMKKLVLDYRGNGGGIMQEAVKIVGMFVPKGTEVVSMRGRGRNNGNEQKFFTENEPWDLAMPIALLVDGYSASAAEIVGGALQDLDRAVIIGQKTFGKGLVQSTLPLGFDSYLKVTTAKYYIPSGRCIQAIDYSHKAEAANGGNFAGADAGGARAVPDSLIKEFRTRGGRRVYDGGGVMPDVRLEPEYSSRFAFTVYAKGFLDDFADEWCKAARKTSRVVEPGSFELTDADWRSFLEFMKTRPTDYESMTAMAIETMRKSAEAEKYLDEQFTAQLDAIAAGLKDDDATNLDLHRAELSKLIEDGIILRRWYSQGVSKHNLNGDKTVARAIGVLDDAANYSKILSSQDTEKK